MNLQELQSAKKKTHEDLHYSDLHGVPCLLILCDKGRMGDTFPHTFACLDLRIRTSDNASTFIQELGRLCRYPSAPGPAKGTGDLLESEAKQQRMVLRLHDSQGLGEQAMLSSPLNLNPVVRQKLLADVLDFCTTCENTELFPGEFELQTLNKSALLQGTICQGLHDLRGSSWAHVGMALLISVLLACCSQKKPTPFPPPTPSPSLSIWVS